MARGGSKGNKARNKANQKKPTGAGPVKTPVGLAEQLDALEEAVDARGVVTAGHVTESAPDDLAEPEPSPDAEIPPQAADIPGAAEPGTGGLEVDDPITALARVRELWTRLSTALDDIETRSTALDEQDNQLRLREEAAAAREQKLNDRDEALIERELDAEQGFVARDAKWRAGRQTLTELADRLASAERVALEAALESVDEMLQTHRSEMASRIATTSLDREIEFGERERSLQLRELALSVDTDLLHEERNRLLAEAEMKAVAAAAETAAENEALTARAGRLAQIVERQEGELAEHAHLLARLGHRSVEGLERERLQLHDRIQSLESELARRPDAAEAAELRELARDRDAWVEERTQLRERGADQARQVEQLRAALLEHAATNERAKNLETVRGALQTEVERLRQELQTLVDDRRSVEPFQICSGMDTDQDLQTRAVLADGPTTLPELVEDLRQRMAARGRFYDQEAVRSFVAGLHTSQLIILEGISGIGKTSLPLAFAQAAGAGVGVVEVQAGWRDRQDVVGFYNPFEGRFSEQKMTALLYQAQTPRWAELPFLVVLDEMNLSHPEHYFADFLSQMEQPDPTNRWIRLMSHRVSGAPNLLRDGMELRLPPNVWFVGTANHDETTSSFAPKTIDRAHILELPREPRTFEPEEMGDRDPTGLAVWRRLFKSAEASNAAAKEDAADFMRGLSPVLEDPFGIGWGARIGAQLGRYVAAVVASGGSVHEALDVFLTHKVLTKLQGRYEFNEGDIDTLELEVDELWTRLRSEDNGYGAPRRIGSALARVKSRLM
jgi:hypothetical protein